ncbi:MAG: winged helix-turn-helix domain-containing protein [Caldimonas sp.]
MAGPGGADAADWEPLAWRFGGFRFDRVRSELLGRDATPIVLRPRAESLLRIFLANPGRLLSKEELITTLWPGTVVTDDSLVQCVGELRLALNDQAQRIIRTLPRRGYRWDEPVEAVDPSSAVASVPMDGAASDRPPLPPADRPRPRAWTTWHSGGAATILIGLAALAVFRLLPGRHAVHIDAEIAARNTVAVLPLRVASNDVKLESVADAVADGVAAQLATRVGMRGIGRAATVTTEGKVLSLSEIARTLKATYAVSGRVGRAALRGAPFVDLQLIQLATGEVVWAKHFEVVDVNDPAAATAIGEAVVIGLRYAGSKVGATRPPGPQEPDAAELTLRGYHELDHVRSLDDIHDARTSFERALKDDPDSVLALSGLGISYLREGGNPRIRLSAAQLAEEASVIERARRLAPDDAGVLLAWASLQLSRGRADLALPAIEKANLLVSSYANGNVLLAEALLQLGRTDEVAAATERAIALGAGDARRVSRAYSDAAEAALMRGENERAYDLARRGVSELPTNMYAHGALAAAAALSGRDDEARQEIAVFLSLWPEATIARYDDQRRSTVPAYAVQRERLYAGLRLGGLAEH